MQQKRPTSIFYQLEFFHLCLEATSISFLFILDPCWCRSYLCTQFISSQQTHVWKSICQHLSLLRMWGPAKECMQLRTMQRGAKSFWLYKVHERDAKLHKPQVYSDFRINIWQSKIWKQNKNTFWQIFKNLQKEVIQVFLVIKWHIDNLLYEIDVNIFAIFEEKKSTSNFINYLVQQEGRKVALSIWWGPTAK